MLPGKPAVIRPLPHLPPNLGRDHQVIPVKPQITNSLPRKLLRPALRIHIGRVDEIDPRIDRSFHYLVHRILVKGADHLRPTLAAKSHGTETEFGDPQPGIAE